MSFWTGITDEDDAEGQLDELLEENAVADRIVCLVDARWPMFSAQTVPTATQQSQSHFSSSLNMILEIMKHKIIASEKSTIGVTLFGADNPTAAAAIAGIQSGSAAVPAAASASGGDDASSAAVRECIDLSAPSLSSIHLLQQLIASSGKIAASVLQPSDSAAGACGGGGGGGGGVCPLKAALWSCSAAFKSKGVQPRDSKCIWIFTNDDDPFASASQSERDAALTVAQDCAQVNWFTYASVHFSMNPNYF